MDVFYSTLLKKENLPLCISIVLFQEKKMSKWSWAVFIIGTGLWVSHEFGSSNNGSTGSSSSSSHVLPMSPPGPPLLRSIFDLLGLVFRIEQANAADGTVLSKDNKITGGDTYWRPEDFVNRNGLRTRYDVEQFDKKAYELLVSCTKMVNRSERNYIAKLEKRKECLSKNYSSDDLTYMGEKFNDKI